MCPILLGIDKLVKEKVMNKKALGIIDSSIRGVYAGLEKVYSMLKDAYDQVQDGKWPDFTQEVPFPPAPSPPPSSPSDMPSWFIIAWKVIENGLNFLATRNSKIAEFLPPIEAAGNELVKDLMQYFSPSHNHQIPTLTSFPALGAS